MEVLVVMRSTILFANAEMDSLVRDAKMPMTIVQLVKTHA